MSLSNILSWVMVYHARIKRGGGGIWTPSEKSQSYRVSQQYWSGSYQKLQNYQASIQCWAITGPLLVVLMDPLPPHQLKKKKTPELAPSGNTFWIRACLLIVAFPGHTHLFVFLFVFFVFFFVFCFFGGGGGSIKLFSGR